MVCQQRPKPIISQSRSLCPVNVSSLHGDLYGAQGWNREPRETAGLFLPPEGKQRCGRSLNASSLCHESEFYRLGSSDMGQYKFHVMVMYE